MKEKIGNVILDYEYYHGSDDYSDGDIELDLLKMVRNYNISPVEHIANDNRWPILYHLSPMRGNIVEWYPFENGCTVLEVGSGCGAVTSSLCNKSIQVTCNDLSKQRSLINATRNHIYDNLKIYVGNFNDLKLKEKFDYITLIGVFEYAAYYTQGDKPFHQFLNNLKQFLKPSGKILIAIENKFGLKYWAGCAEDHTGCYFDNLEGYKKTKSLVRTFSKVELEKIFEECGFTRYKFYYPFPDYKFAKQIFCDDYLPKPEDLTSAIDTYDNERMLLFDETAVFKNLLDSNMFSFFSNSYFVELSCEEDM